MWPNEATFYNISGKGWGRALDVHVMGVIVVVLTPVGTRVGRVEPEPGRHFGRFSGRVRSDPPVILRGRAGALGAARAARLCATPAAPSTNR